MKVFISWSGTRSKHIATALRDWLPNVLQSVRPFISSQDILKGARGNVQITKELETAAIGIICLTPENLLAPWILFEAGALSKLSSAYVCTYLYDLDPSDISPPLGQFQHTKSSKEETFALVQTINAELPDDSGLDADRLKDAFDVWWKKLQSQLKSVPDKPDDEASPPARSDVDKLDELLELVRRASAGPAPWTLGTRFPATPGDSGSPLRKPSISRQVQCDIDLTSLSKQKRKSIVSQLLDMPCVAMSKVSLDHSNCKVILLGETMNETRDASVALVDFLSQHDIQGVFNRDCTG